MIPKTLFFFKGVLATLGLFLFDINFRTGFSSFTNETCQDFN